MKTHSRLLSILLAVALLLSLTMTAALAEPRKITFWHCFGGTIGEALQATVDAFNASQTDVFVEATFQGSMTRR